MKNYAHLTGKEHVFDLYCGVGSIGLYLSDECAKITGIELIPEAIEDAAHNAALNNVHHAEYHTEMSESSLIPVTSRRKTSPI